MKAATIIIIVFLLIGAFIIYSNLGVSLSEKDGRRSFAWEFGKWIFNVGKTTVRVVGYAFNQQWFPEVDQAKLNATDETPPTPQVFYIDE
jgi:hypothetical protein